MDTAPSIGEQRSLLADIATLRATLCHCMVQHALLATSLLISAVAQMHCSLLYTCWAANG
jgi:hypothetical protein